MKADNRVPVKHLHGSIYGLQSDFYFRIYRGKQILQRKPRKFSAAQKLNQKRFGEIYGTANRGVPVGMRKKPPP